MKLAFTVTKAGPDEWTLALRREDTDELLLTLGGLRTEAEARHAAEGLRAAVHTAPVRSAVAGKAT
ncbi:hypothetical protein [Streptacidiphilus rugosus]|uniref:hypothetical protein n=1 Tax=Streptacidiphilus rugosus TaxID=405783 RepID=UPI00055CE47C|nr:hypothetical protein [Streptacidiphilus rugosus]